MKTYAITIRNNGADVQVVNGTSLMHSDGQLAVSPYVGRIIEHLRDLCTDTNTRMSEAKLELSFQEESKLRR